MFLTSYESVCTAVLCGPFYSMVDIGSDYVDQFKFRTVQYQNRFKSETATVTIGSHHCRPMASEYDPAGHGAQTNDDVAPAVGSIQ